MILGLDYCGEEGCGIHRNAIVSPSSTARTLPKKRDENSAKVRHSTDGSYPSPPLIHAFIEAGLHQTIVLPKYKKIQRRGVIAQPRMRDIRAEERNECDCIVSVYHAIWWQE